MPSHDLWYMHDVRSQTRWITKRREKKMITKCAQIDYEILSIYNQLHACMQQTHQRSTNIPTIGAISYLIAHVHRIKVNCKFNRKHFCFYRLNKNCLVWKKKKMTNYIQDIGSEWNVQWVVNRAYTHIHKYTKPQTRVLLSGSKQFSPESKNSSEMKSLSSQFVYPKNGIFFFV